MIDIPKFYHTKLRRKLKKDMIDKEIKNFMEPVRFEWTDKKGKKQVLIHQETEKNAEEYRKELEKLDLKELSMIGKTEEYKKTNFQFLEKIYALDTKTRALVRIFNKNRTWSEYIANNNARFFNVGNMRYMKMLKDGNYNTKSKMIEYSFYEGNPFPITFMDDYYPFDSQGKTIPDALLLRKAQKFEYAQMLATSKLESNVNLAVIFSAIAMIFGLIGCILTAVGLHALEVF